MKVYVDLNKVATIDGHNARLRSEVSRWLENNGCYIGPDQYFQDDPALRRPFEQWTPIDDKWAVFNFNHENMACKFRNDWTDWNESLSYQVITERLFEGDLTHHGLQMLLTEELMWLARQMLIMGRHYTWQVVDFGRDEPLMIDDHTKLSFWFTDPNIAMMFKLVFGGSRVPLPQS